MELGGLREKLEQLAHAWSQNETVSPGTILQIMNNPSLTSIQRKIEKDIASKQQRDQQALERQQQTQEQIAQQQAEIQQRAQQIEELRLQFEQQKIEIDRYKIDADNNTKLQIAAMNSGEEDTSIDQEKIRLQEEKINIDKELKTKDINEKIRHNQQQEQISRITKNKKQ
jgi:flagellar biosynthesis component FlhA